jgi:hypothetical protein
MFQPDRVFSERNPKSGLMEWYFSAREGVFGPYSTKDVSQRILREFIERRKAGYDDGGRSLPSGKGLSLVAKDHNETIEVYDPLKRKKGVDG